MQVTIGTFNLNNLFSRFNFQATVDDSSATEGGYKFEFDTRLGVKLRTFSGRLVHGKDMADTKLIANRILAMDVDVLAVQEVEHIEILKAFNRDFLHSRYQHVALVEGNDRRLIDVGVLSSLPFGAITSFQAKVHPDAPQSRIFSRDLLRIEILHANRRKKLFSVYNTHLKSPFVAYANDPVAATIEADSRRQRQAEMIAAILSDTERPNSSFILLGDMNDTPDSACLQPMLSVDNRPLFNALQSPVETRRPKRESQGPGPQTSAWTYRRNPSGPAPPEFKLIDQIWLSQQLLPKFSGSHIDRRSRHGGDGSDHDPAWIELEL